MAVYLGKVLCFEDCKIQRIRKIEAFDRKKESCNHPIIKFSRSSRRDQGVPFVLILWHLDIYDGNHLAGTIVQVESHRIGGKSSH